MILLEVVDAERRKEKEASTSTSNVPTHAHPAPPRPSTSSSVELPDYATSQAQAVRKRSSLDKEMYEKPTGKKSSSVSSDRKFRRIIVIALATYFVLSIAIGLPLFFVLRRQVKNQKNSNSLMRASNMGGYPPPPSVYQQPLDISLIPPIDETPVECNNWTFVPASGPEGPHYSLQYFFPANETIYVHSNLSSNIQPNSIPPIQGMFHVGVSPNSSQHEASISVSASDIGSQDLQKLSVCKLQLDCGWGLAIYVPANDTNVANAFFNIDLSLPQPSKSTNLGGLITNLPNFNQSFESLENFDYLGNFIVQGSVGSITADYVQAEIILIKGVASEVSGTFNTSNTIILESMLAPVGANVSLYNDAQGAHPPTMLQVTTGVGNSDVNLNVTLHSNSKDPNDYPPAFQSSVRTIDGNLAASFFHDPSLQASCLQLDAKTNNKQAQVFVDNVYQGTFDVNTMLGNADFDADAAAIDPSGKNRNRTVDYDYTSNSRLYGWVGWGDRVYGGSDHEASGHISVTTSLNEASLKLTDVPNVSADFVMTPASKSFSSRDVCSP